MSASPSTDALPFLEISHSPLEDVPAEGLQASLCYLMTRFAWQPCPGLARAIARILALLHTNPAIAAVPVQHRAYRSAQSIWEGIADRLCVQWAAEHAGPGPGSKH